MKKPLSEMRLEELWALFPISLVAPSEDRKSMWAGMYTDMERFLTEHLSDCRVVRISHIGSTAITGIWAKNIVDILLEIAAGENLNDVAEHIEAAGFLRMASSAGRISFNWGYTEDGFAEKVYHLHLRHAGDNDELYFRDYLNERRPIAEEYERLKLDLWRKFEHDRDAYTNAKSAFVERYTAEARKTYPNRY
ncbi:MAG: GrpB family protein [Roseburia sp.]|nr:GrpB family protein [Roseburia sp.]